MLTIKKNLEPKTIIQNNLDYRLLEHKRFSSIIFTILICFLFSCKVFDRTNILKQKLELKELHPGIFYKEVYRSKDTIALDHVFSTSIYYLLTKNAKDNFHKLKNDECWNFFEGQPIIFTIINSNGEMQKVILGEKNKNVICYQYTIKAGSWYFATLEKGDYALVGLTVAPGFELSDYQLGIKDSLIKQFPKYENLIIQNCKN